MVGERRHLTGGISHQPEAGFRLPAALVGGQVIDGGLPRGTCEQAAQGVADRAGLAGFPGETVAGGKGVVFPEEYGRASQGFAPVFGVVRFAEEVGQGESNIEHRVPPVDDLVVEQDQLTAVDQNVLGAVVPVNQSLPGLSRLVHQGLEEGTCFGKLFGAVPVKRLQAKRFEEPNVGEDHLEAMGRQTCPTVDGAEQLTELPNMIRIHDPLEQKRLPVLVRFRNGPHRQDEVLAVLEHQGGNGPWGREGRKPPHAQGFPVDAFGTAEPGRGDAELFQRLLQHPGVAERAGNQHGAIRYATRQTPHGRGLAGVDPAGAAKPLHERTWLLDVEVGHGDGALHRPGEGGSASKTAVFDRQTGKGLASRAISRFFVPGWANRTFDRKESMSADTMRDLLVVGAGPVGLITAVLGARAGLDVEIVDQEWRIATRSYACVLHPHSLDLLDRLGLLARAIELGTRVETVGFYEGAERRAEVRLSALSVRHPYALVLYQDDLEGLIEDVLREQYGRRVGWGRRLDGLIWNDDSVTAILESLHHQATGEATKRWTEVVDRRLLAKARYIAGADGPRSRLVHLLGTESETAGEPMHYGILEFEPQQDAEVSEELRVAIDGTTTHVLWPLPGGTCRWSLQSDGTDWVPGEDTPAAGTPPSLPQKIRRVAPWFSRGVRSVDWAMRVEFPKRIVHQFGRGRCWALGDAAHQTAPGGAQGMNLALREAEEFVDVLRGVIREGVPLDALHATSHRWRSDWRRLLGFEPSIEAEAGTDPWVATHAAQLASSLPASGDEFVALLNQLGLRWLGAPKV